MGGSTEQNAHIFDDETSSMASFEAVVRSRSGSPGPGTAVATQMPVSGLVEEAAEVEEDVPDVVYVVEYLGYGNKVLDTLESAEPFDEIPSFRGEKAEADTRKKPILEIVTQVNTPRLRGARVPPGMPVKARHQYHDDDDTSDSEYDDVHVGRSNRRGETIKTPVMKIHSQHLINTLQAVVKYYPYVNIVGKMVSIPAPYKVLFHHRKALEDFKHAQPACHSDDYEYYETTVRHIDVLLNFLDASMGDKIREEEERHRKSTPLATFENYWLLLKPGEVVLTKKNHIWTPYVISKVTRETSPHGEEQAGAYSVICWSLACTGAHVTRSMSRHKVAPWTGESPIESLHVIPAAFFPNKLSAQHGMPILQWQAQLGRMYWKLLKKPTYMDYDGMLVGGSMSPGNMAINYRGPSGWMTGRVVVDADGFFKNVVNSPQIAGKAPRRGPPGGPHDPHLAPDHLPHYEPRCGCDACAKAAESMPKVPLYHRFDGLDPQKDCPPPSDLFYIALSPTIPAFILGDRRWGEVSLARLKPVRTDREAFKWLVLDEEIKTMIRALITKYSNDGCENGQIAPWANDFVKNKGEGRIFLLHGSPGVGKTCTAEAIAELTGRPLISLTSGDLSTNEFNVESNLSYFLRLGQRYGALVLLDEADVYLERRHSKDISRNGLVSIFLRALEYYRGVLFLTTNRVQTFDPAFTSRIHVALHYKPLTDADRERIWANNFERLDRDSNGKVHVSVSVREYAYASGEVSSLRWNGREIRNAMQTAVALAEAQAKEEGQERITVTDKHLRSVVKMSRGFKEYLRRGEAWDDGGSDVVDDEDESNISDA